MTLQRALSMIAIAIYCLLPSRCKRVPSRFSCTGPLRCDLLFHSIQQKSVALTCCVGELCLRASNVMIPGWLSLLSDTHTVYVCFCFQCTVLCEFGDVVCFRRPIPFGGRDAWLMLLNYTSVSLFSSVKVRTISTAIDTNTHTRTTWITVSRNSSVRAHTVRSYCSARSF